MHISQIPDVTKVADVVANDVDWNKLVTFNFCVDKQVYNARPARIYFLVSNGKIIKIGGSDSEGGIKSTMKFYQDGYSGSPDRSGRTLGVPTALRGEIDAGHAVEVFMKFAPMLNVILPGLTEKFGESSAQVAAGYKQMETLWVNQYKELQGGKAPALNIQENKARHPKEHLDAVTYYFTLLDAGLSTAKNPRKLKRLAPEEQAKLAQLIKLAIPSYKKVIHPEVS